MFKQFFNKVGGAIKYRLQGFVRDLPFRMTIGKFGIWLVKIGRILQERYANWNGEFRLKVEYVPNPDYVKINVSSPITDDVILTFEGPNWQKEKKIKMVDELFAINGVCKITLCRYEVNIIKGKVFAWKELLPDIERVILNNLTVKV